MNLPLRNHIGEYPVKPLIVVENANVVFEAVKLAEDGSGDVIVRLYEGTGDRTHAKISVNFEYENLVVVDLLERETQNQGILMNSQDGKIHLELRPFKIATLRFTKTS